ncbi:unnamed protein product [Ectocarpus sp. CCAP 1310/34]|nr:unnamed protein product [Ectocarpus sp. CCAP 1310/34]
MKLYGMRRKSDTLAFVMKFLAVMSGTGVPRSFRMDNGGEFVGRDFIAFCDNAGIRRTYTAPGTPHKNGPAESAILRVNKAGHAARLKARRLFPKIDFTRVTGFGRDGERLWLESDLNTMVPVKNLGDLRWYSGCFDERDWDAGTLKSSQQTYAEELGMEFGVEYGKEIPLPVGLKLSEFDQDEAVVSWPFRELIGSLMWLARQTRPDIANEVRAVARYCVSPKEIHWRAGLGILGYVVWTSGLGITFRRGSVAGLSMEVFADADYASKAADRRSVPGGLVMCGEGCISWFSRTQKCVTLSRTETEYVSLADVMKEVLLLEQVWRFMLPEVGLPCIPVFEDNQGAIQLAQNPFSNSDSKHIDIRHHFIRELVGRKGISIFHVVSAYQHADFLTKALHVGDFEFVVIS